MVGAGVLHRPGVGRGEGVVVQGGHGLAALLQVLGERVAARLERPVVLEDLAERDEQLAQVDDAAHPPEQLPRRSPASWTAVTVPSSTSMIGPSTVSQSAIAVAFPRLSSLTWVPIATKWRRITIVAGFTAQEARPAVRARPYTSRSPPGRFG